MYTANITVITSLIISFTFDHLKKRPLYSTNKEGKKKTKNAKKPKPTNKQKTFLLI